MERKRGVYVKLIVFLFVVVFVGILNIFLFHHIIENTAYSLIGAITQRIYNSQHVDENLVRITANESLERENAMLRRQLNVTPRIALKLKQAKIIVVQRNAIASTIRIDKGTDDDIKEGMVVIAAGNVLIGKVINVFKKNAEVLLVDDPRSIVSVRVGGTSLLAESRGVFRNEVILNLISQTENILPETTVVTSGLDIFPESLLVARITSVERGESKLFKDVRAKMYFDITQSPIVFIIQ